MSERKVRILIVENDPRFLKMLRRLLSLRFNNLDIYSAQSPEEALDITNKDYFHLVIIDKRLEMDTDNSDVSGIDLIPNLSKINPSLKFIMLTNWPTYQDVRSIFPERTKYNEEILLDYLSKEDDSEDEWCNKIKLAIDTRLNINFGLEINMLGFKWNEMDKLLVHTTLHGKRIKGSDKEIISNLSVELKDLFSRIYCKESKITVTPVGTKGHSGTCVVKVHRVGLLTEIFKFGEREKIEIEYDNYINYVDGVIPNRTRTDLTKFARLKNLGAIAYSFIGANLDKIQDFSTFFYENGSRNIKLFLKNFFTDNCKIWYDVAQYEIPIDLKELYCQYLNLSLPNLLERIKTRLKQYSNQTSIYLREIGANIQNPILAFTNTYLDPLNVKLCVTHGDLNPGNIMVEDKRGWLIDFYRTGKAHALRDFIKLETSVMLTM